MDEPFDLLKFLVGCWFVVRWHDIASRYDVGLPEDDAMLQRATLGIIQRVTRTESLQQVADK